MESLNTLLQAAEGVELGQRVLQRLLDGSITGPPTLLAAATLLEGCLRELLVDDASPIQVPIVTLGNVICGPQKKYMCHSWQSMGAHAFTDVSAWAGTCAPAAVCHPGQYFQAPRVGPAARQLRGWLQQHHGSLWAWQEADQQQPAPGGAPEQVCLQIWHPAGFRPLRPEGFSNPRALSVVLELIRPL